MIRAWAGLWRRLSLSLRMGLFIFCVSLLGIQAGVLSAELSSWAPWGAAALAGVVATLWTRPLEAVVEAAHRLVAGGDVSLLKDRNESELRFLARAVDELGAQLDQSRRELEARNHELERANEVLEQLSITDGLTRLHNHRHFQDRYLSETRRSDRTGHPLCLVLIDIDDFKRLNDDYGHSAGDKVLAGVAMAMNEQVRETDYLARYGGEEFAMLLPEATLEGAVQLAEKLRFAVAAARFEVADGADPVGVTVSLGVALFAHSPDATFDAADRALYEAKASGKDCVITAS
ncbi:MAG: GGDEF domain-containing protein [Deltaproteobacteria bacterium]|nr:GGDEF domain-containing protein [Deltaproteobacteria bacterium]MBW2396599.1 GGDEF domain-containing protein [Deltaproteobacteria bacterium]